MPHLSQGARLAAIASIQDSLRRSLFDLVSRSDEPVGRDEAAAALGMPRSTAAFHLDRLVESGLLAVEFARRSGRTGPGAGRPAKLYRKAEAEISVAVPERHYDLMGSVLAEAIDESEQSGLSARESLVRVARERGKRIAAASASLDSMLENAGYEPRTAGDDTIELTNCPFHTLAAQHTSLVCAANLALLEGAVGEDKRAVLSPREGRCCVRLERVAPTG